MQLRFPPRQISEICWSDGKADHHLSVDHASWVKLTNTKKKRISCFSSSLFVCCFISNLYLGMLNVCMVRCFYHLFSRLIWLSSGVRFWCATLFTASWICVFKVTEYVGLTTAGAGETFIEMQPVLRYRCNRFLGIDAHSVVRVKIQKSTANYQWSGATHITTWRSRR